MATRLKWSLYTGLSVKKIEKVFFLMNWIFRSDVCSFWGFPATKNDLLRHLKKIQFSFLFIKLLADISKCFVIFLYQILHFFSKIAQTFCFREFLVNFFYVC